MSKCFSADTQFLELLLLLLLLILLSLYCHSEKKVAAISKHCRYHDCPISNDSSNHSLKSLHCTYCTVTIIPFYHQIVYLEINLFCNNNTNPGVNKITDMEKAHRLRFCVFLQQAFTCKSISYFWLWGSKSYWFMVYVMGYENSCL